MLIVVTPTGIWTLTLGIDINLVQQMSSKIGIITEYMVPWNLNGGKLQMKPLLEKCDPNQS
jgi:hypothetical protein